MVLWYYDSVVAYDHTNYDLCARESFESHCIYWGLCLVAGRNK